LERLNAKIPGMANFPALEQKIIDSGPWNTGACLVDHKLPLRDKYELSTNHAKKPE
jgi:hypothetical protein